MSRVDELKLPELPQWMERYSIPNDTFTAPGELMLADRMRDYARAAIAALQPVEAVAWRRDTPYGIGYSFASEDVMRDMADWLAPTTPPSLPAGWVLVPERMHVPADAWESAAFSFGGPAAGDGEAYLDCTLWVGNIENDDGTKTYGLHVSCDECPEEGMTTLAEFAAAPQPQREASEAGQGDSKETLVRAATARVRALGEWDGKTFDPQLSEILRKLTTHTQGGE